MRLIIVIVLGHVAFSGNRFIFTLHSVALGASPMEIGLLLGVLMLGPMLLSVHFGRWSDRMGYTRLCAIGLAMLFSAGMIAAAGAAMPLLYVASALTGSGYMLAHVAMMNAIGKAKPAGELMGAFSVVAMTFSLSALAGPLISGFVIDQLGYAAAYLAMAMFACASAALLWWAARRYSVVPAPAASHAGARVFDLLEDRGLRPVFLVTGLLSMAWDMFIFLAPLHGVAAGLTATAIGTVVAAFSAGTFAIRLGLPFMSRRLSEWRIMSLTLFVTAVGFVAFPLMHGFWPLAGASFLLGMSLGCSQPVSMSLVYRTSPPHRAGEAVGVRSAITSFCQTTLPMLFGGLGAAVGVVAVFWCASILLLVGGSTAARRASKLSSYQSAEKRTRADAGTASRGRSR